jgi:hypothetical protein
MRKFRSGSDFELPEEEPQLAMLVDITELGTQQTDWGPKFRLSLCFELKEKDSNGHPFLIRTSVNLGPLTPKAKATPIFTALNGGPIDPDIEFDPETVLGKICILGIEHATSKDGTKTYANISGTMRAKKADEPWKPVMPITCLSFDSFDKKLFESRPKWIQDQIMESEEFKELTAPRPKPPAGDGEAGNGNGAAAAKGSPKGKAKSKAKAKAKEPEPRAEPWSKELDDDFPSNMGGGES